MVKLKIGMNTIIKQSYKLQKQVIYAYVFFLKVVMTIKVI